jgi:hypothetical protein
MNCKTDEGGNFAGEWWVGKGAKVFGAVEEMGFFLVSGRKFSSLSS